MVKKDRVKSLTAIGKVHAERQMRRGLMSHQSRGTLK